MIALIEVRQGMSAERLEMKEKAMQSIRFDGIDPSSKLGVGNEREVRLLVGNHPVRSVVYIPPVLDSATAGL